MKLSQLNQFHGVLYSVVEGYEHHQAKGLLASHKDFFVHLEKVNNGWFMHFSSLTMDGHKHAGEYCIDVQWSRNVMLCMFERVIQFALTGDDSTFPVQLHNFVI